MNPLVGHISIPNWEALVTIDNGRTLRVRGSLALAGTLLVNTTAGTSATVLQFERTLPGTVPVSGEGVIYLNAAPSNLETSYLNTAGNAVAALGGDVVIRGTGRMYGSYQLAGTVSADDANDGAIELVSATVAGQGGTGRLEAVGADLGLRSGTLPTTVSDLRMEASEGGSFYVSNGATLRRVGVVGPIRAAGVNTTMTLDDCVIEGDLTMARGVTASVPSSNLTLNGTALINESAENGSVTALRFEETGSLLGSGAVILNAHAANLETALLMTANDALVTLGEAWRVEGSGRVYGQYLLGGTIRANDSLLGRSLELVSATVTGQGGTGRLEAVGASLGLRSGALRTTVSDLRMEAREGGSFYVANGATLRGVDLVGPLRASGVNTTMTLDDCVIEGDLTMARGVTASVPSPNLTLNGTALINESAEDGAVASLRFERTGSLLGSGAVILNAYADNLETALLTTANDALVTLGEAWRVEGSGRVYGQYLLGGTIRANDSLLGRSLELVSATVTGQGGTGHLEAVGASLGLRSGALRTTVSDLRMEARQGGSFYVANGATLRGVDLVGPLRASGVNTTMTLDDCVIEGDLTMARGVTASVPSPNLTLNGTALINESAEDGAVASLRFERTGSLLGSGAVILNAYAGNLDTAQLFVAGNAIGTLAEGVALRGSGRTYGQWVVEGLLAPSDISASSPVGRLDNRHGLTLAPAATLQIDVASESSFDKITGTGSVTVAGTLSVRLHGDFDPNPEREFQIISAGAVNGTFAAVDSPVGFRVIVSYGTNHVTIRLACPADINRDGAVTSQDFFDFLTAFFATDPSADFNNDTLVNSQDFFDFLAAFFVGC